MESDISRKGKVGLAGKIEAQARGQFKGTVQEMLHPVGGTQGGFARGFENEGGCFFGENVDANAPEQIFILGLEIV